MDGNFLKVKELDGMLFINKGGMGMTYFAHSKEGVGQSERQTMQEHATGVASLMAQFSQQFCDTAYAKNLGLLHDAGKY